jgi:hypothetical protein
MHLDVPQCLAVKHALLRICGKASESRPGSRAMAAVREGWCISLETLRRFDGDISAVSPRNESSGHPTWLIDFSLWSKIDDRSTVNLHVHSSHTKVWIRCLRGGCGCSNLCARSYQYTCSRDNSWCTRSDVYSQCFDPWYAQIDPCMPCKRCSNMPRRWHSHGKLCPNFRVGVWGSPKMRISRLARCTVSLECRVGA